MQKSATARPPGTEDALRLSIRTYGVIHPVVVTPGGVVIDGELRRRIADEEGVPYTVKEWDPRDVHIASIVNEVQQRTDNERHHRMSNQIVWLASERDEDGVGRWPEEVIAAAMNVSTGYVIDYMRKYVERPTEANRDLFPRERRKVNGEVTTASVTTADIEPPDPPAMPEMPELHEVLEYIPEQTAQQRRALRASLRREGQQQPVLVTADGRLVDGRARWKILTEWGIVPQVEVTTDNAWVTSLQRNLPRIADANERLLLVGRLPGRHSPPLPFDMGPPTTEQLSNLFELGVHKVRTFRAVAQAGNEKLISAVLDDKIKMNGAARIIRSLPEEQWETALDEVISGRPLGIVLGTGVARTDPTAVITADQINRVTQQLAAIGFVVEGAAGLSRAITPDQAARLMSDLASERRHLGRLYTMLKQRKETT